MVRGKKNRGAGMEIGKWRMGARMASERGHGTWFLNHARERREKQKRQ